MDRANSYVSGSRHKDHCRWFFNCEEVDAHLTETLNTKIYSERITQIASWMSQDNSEKLAIEQLDSYLESITVEQNKVQSLAI
jgi:hypothetical protein